MSPSNDPIADIKSRLDVVDVVGQKVTLKKAGSTFKGLCPFHSEKSPSFVVFPDKGNYHCFGCGANGDIFSFVMKTENIEFPDALRELANRAGIELKPRRGDDGTGKHRGELIQLLDQATLFYQQALRRPDGQAARDYLEKRGISQSTIDQFRIGWAPDRWDSLYQYLVERGGDPALIASAGLTAERETGGYYDRFRGRLMFPIVGDRGDLVGFGGRLLASGEPKYLNSPQTDLFDKGATLFGIDQARTTIKATNRATIVEGYVDVLIAHQYGFKDVVASLGTALTERQVQALKRLTRTLVLALDADSAGDIAVLRGLEVARQVYGDAQVAVPLPQGLVRLESRLGADILIADLPRGRDPDEIIRENTNDWRSIVDDARSVVDYYFEVVLGGADLKSAKGTATAVRQLLPIISEVRDTVQQALYLQRLSDRVHIAEQLLASELARLRLTAPAAPKRVDDATPETPRRRSTLDEYALGLLLRYPARSRSFLDELREDDWELVESREVFLEVCRQAADGRLPDANGLRQDLAEPLSAWLDAVLVREDARPALDDAALSQEHERCVRDLRRRLRRSRLPSFSALLRDLEASDDDDDAAASVHRQVERELTQLEVDERLSKRARVWSAL
jgi:DNA primase